LRRGGGAPWSHRGRCFRMAWPRRVPMRMRSTKQGSTDYVFQKRKAKNYPRPRGALFLRGYAVRRQSTRVSVLGPSPNSLSSAFVTVSRESRQRPRRGRFSLRRTNSDGDVVSSILSGAGTGRRGRHRNHTNDTRSRPCDSIRPPRWRGWRPPPTMPSRPRSTQRSYARSHSPF
jgi:hypothetical protein